MVSVALEADLRTEGRAKLLRVPLFRNMIHHPLQHGYQASQIEFRTAAGKKTPSGPPSTILPIWLLMTPALTGPPTQN